ncbi:MAG: hypothetical protein AAF567_17850 [Actinomycetota bacterium]
MTDTSPLPTGATLPPLAAKDLEGNDVDITATLAGHWGVVQFYRGHW